MDITYTVPTKSYYSSYIDENIDDCEERCIVVDDEEVIEELAKILIDNQDIELSLQEKNIAIKLVCKIISSENLQDKLEEYYRDELKEIFINKARDEE